MQKKGCVEIKDICEVGSLEIEDSRTLKKRSTKEIFRSQSDKPIDETIDIVI